MKPRRPRQPDRTPRPGSREEDAASQSLPGTSPWQYARARRPLTDEAEANRGHTRSPAPPRRQAPTAIGGQEIARGDDASPAAASKPRIRNNELRLYGLNACRAMFRHRPQDLRKVYLTASRMRDLRDVLAHCVQNRLGYRVVEEADLERLTESRHHEGVCFDTRPPQVPTLEQLLESTQGRPSLLIWLDGVSNPHNLGAVLRSAAHFGVDAVLLPPDSTLALSGAACRVAEGGAEVVPVIRISDPAEALAAILSAGFTVAATHPHQGESIFALRMPERLLLVFGAERTGVGGGMLAASTMTVGIPGSGAVESLNIAAAMAICAAEWARWKVGA